MKQKLAPVLVFALVFSIGCVDEDQDTDYDVEGVESEITATNARFESFVVAQQWDSVAALYTDDAIMLPQGSTMQRGRNAIRDGFVQMGPMGVSDIQLETVEVEVSGDLAYEIGQYTLLGEGGAQLDRGKYLVVWKRDGDQWKLHRDIFNSDSPPQEGGMPSDTTRAMPGDTARAMPADTVSAI